MDGKREAAPRRRREWPSELTVRLDVDVSVDGVDDAIRLERAIAAEGRRAARELYMQVIQAIDERAVAEAGGIRQRRETRWVATLMGRVRLSRSRVKVDAMTVLPLDRLLGLGRVEASPALQRVVRYLAARLSYRDVARVVREITGESFARQDVARIVRNEDHRIT
jgi:hypothetical protein